MYRFFSTLISHLPYDDSIDTESSTVVVGLVKTPREMVNLYARGFPVNALQPLPSDSDLKALPPYRDVNDAIQQSSDFLNQLSPYNEPSPDPGSASSSSDSN